MMTKFDLNHYRDARIIEEAALTSYPSLIISPENLTKIALVASREIMGVALGDDAGNLWLIHMVHACWSEKDNSRARESI